jgi:hypothetical protein
MELMMRFISCGLWLVLAFATMETKAVLYSNVLKNAGFEEGLSSTNVAHWGLFGNAFRYSTPTAHGGSYALDTWGNWWPSGQWNASGAFQLYPTVEGELWEAGVWVKMADKIQGRASAGVSIEFYNAATQQIWSGTSAEKLTASSPTNEWIYVSVRGQASLYTAFVRMVPFFLQSPAFEAGAAWFDDCSLYQIPSNVIAFAGYNWRIVDGFSSPGENYYSTNCVWVDTNGWMHMKLKQINGVWRCPFLEGPQALGFGEYRWYTGTALERLDSNLVVGLFTYAQEPVYGTNQNEVDIEISHAFEGTETNCLLYTVQPYTLPGNGYQHPLETTNELVTHRFIWRPDRIDWLSYYGHTPEPPLDTNQILAGWRFAGRGIPIETNERTYMNLWLCFTNAPADTQHVEMIVRDFHFIPFDGVLLSDGFDDGSLSNGWVRVGDGVSESNGCLIVTPDAAGNLSGCATVEPIHWNERGEQYVFEALLKTVTVASACSGNDMGLVTSFSSGTNDAGNASNAVQLIAQYDEAADQFSVSFYTKTNKPGDVGRLRYSGTLTNVSHWFSSGGIEFRMELGGSEYAVGLRSAQGSVIPLSAGTGCSTGAHHLVETLSYGYWFLGASNNPSGSQGKMHFNRAAVGISSQSESVSLSCSLANQHELSFTAPAFFDTRYILESTTNLLEPFAVVAEFFERAGGSVAFTNSGAQDAAYYRLRLE